jgi:hypothetical protein
MTIDRNGNILFTNIANGQILQLNSSTLAISTIAGTTTGDSGDNGLATSAQFHNPYGLCVDISNNIYVADTLNNRIREINASTGIVTTVAGSGTFGVTGYSGDNDYATAAQLNNPNAVSVDTLGNMYIADSGNNCIRKINAGSSIIYTLSGIYQLDNFGNPLGGYTGDGGASNLAQLNYPTYMAIGQDSNLYFSDSNNLAVRVFSNVDNFTSTVTVSPTFTASPTVTPTITLTLTFSATKSFSPTNTPTNSQTPTATYTTTLTNSPSATNTSTPTITATLTNSVTNSPSSTASPVLSSTPTVSHSATPSPIADYTNQAINIGNGKIVVYPNPIRSGQNLKIYFPTIPTSYSVQIYSAAMQIVLSAECSTGINQGINVNGFSNGIYFARVKAVFQGGNSVTSIQKVAILR